VLAFLRRAPGRSTRPVLVACNFTPVVRRLYRIGVPVAGVWHELLNSDSEVYGGSGVGNLGGVVADDAGWHSRPHALDLSLPPLSCLFLAPDGSR
jgi:1,4-alpha-glucan branching enzyme